MALTADEKERIMAARGESRGQSSSSTRRYMPLIDGKPLTMISMCEMTKAELEEYCIRQFGKERFGGFVENGK